MPIQKYFDEASQTWKAVDSGTINDGINKYTPADIKRIDEHLADNETDLIQRAINVRMPPYNAKADGVTDDTQAIKQALLTGRNVYLPKGVGSYIINEGLIFTSNQFVFAEGGKNAVTIKASANFDTVNYTAMIEMQGYHPRLANVQLDCRDVTIDVVKINAEYEPSISHVKILGGKQGVRLDKGLESRFEHVSVNGTSEEGFRIYNVADAFFLNCSTDNCLHGLRSLGGSITALHFHAIKSKEHGFYLDGASSSQFYGCHADTNGFNGFHVTNTDSITFTDCWSFRNSAAVPGSYHNWLLNNLTNSNFSGCSANNHTLNNTKTSFSFVGVSSNVSFIGCYADKDIEGYTNRNVNGVNFIGCKGQLKKYNGHFDKANFNITLNAGANTVLTYDVGYDLTLTSNFKVFKVTFSSRGSTDKLAVFGHLYFAATNDTSGTSTTAKTFVYGDNNSAGAKFSVGIARTGGVLSLTITNVSTETVSYGFELEQFREAKWS
jgi:Pectate lyase superfamily protein